jgi:hypothetical protein
MPGGSSVFIFWQSLGHASLDLEEGKPFNSFINGDDESRDLTFIQWTEPRSDHSMRPDRHCL